MAARRGDGGRGLTVELYVKQRPGTPPEAYAAEAAGLRWLAEAEGCPIVRVAEVGRDRLLLELIATSAPSRRAARNFGAGLAQTHLAGADSFGQLPPGVDRGFIAELPLPEGHDWGAFGPFYAEARILPFARTLAESGLLGDTGVFEELGQRLGECDRRVCGPAEEPARLHGDLWAGNVLWRRTDAVLIDPSAHGGHRESDLAMLALFGLPYLEDVFEAYDEAWPLSPGWRDRQPLHQIYPLLVHGVLFGGSYPQAAEQAARRVLVS